MLVVSAHLCMAINLYKECRGTSDKECQLINRVVINRMHDNNQDACSVIFAKGQFSWTRKTPQKLQFDNYQEMINYYKVYDSAQLMRAFNNVDKSQDENNNLKTADNMLFYYDRTLKVKPRWAHKMQVAYATKNFVFCKA